MFADLLQASDKVVDTTSTDQTTTIPSNPSIYTSFLQTSFKFTANQISHSKTTTTMSDQQPSLIGGHAQFVKGAAEVSTILSRSE
jgi:hypothetical protein